MMLTKEGWEAARSFLFSHARPLEQKLFTYHFENGSREDAVIELANFQNSDGGFGNSLEPDFRLEGSSPLATTVGLQIARDLHVDKDHPVIVKAMHYLESTYDVQMETWHAVPPEVNNVPHAPWWHFDERKGFCGVQTTWANPNAEIVGYFHLYQKENPLLEGWTKKAAVELAKLLRPVNHHDFLCYSRLFQYLPDHEDIKKDIYLSLSETVHETVCKDPAKWNEYVAKPLDIAPFPSSPFHEELKEETEIQLDAEINSQHEIGCWQPSWSWFGEYQETWKKAENEWSGILTLSMLRSLDSFGKINR